MDKRIVAAVIAVMLGACSSEPPVPACEVLDPAVGLQPTCDGAGSDAECEDDEDWHVDCGLLATPQTLGSYAYCDGAAVVCRRTDGTATGVTPRCVNVCDL